MSLQPKKSNFSQSHCDVQLNVKFNGSSSMSSILLELKRMTNNSAGWDRPDVSDAFLHREDETEESFQVHRANATTDRNFHCSCLERIYHSFESGNFQEVRDRALHFLSQAASLQPEVVLDTLHLLAGAFVHQRELARARSTLTVQRKLIEAGDWRSGQAPLCASTECREKKKWLIRLLRTQGLIEEADGHREEAMEIFSQLWAMEAELYGPGSLRCLRTYLSIADMKTELGETDAAVQMLRDTIARLLELGTPKSSELWVRSHRSLAELLMRTGDPSSCTTAAIHLQQVILSLQERLRGESGADFEVSADPPRSNPKGKLLTHSTSIEYGVALTQYADALLLSQGKGTTEAALSSLIEADGIFQSVFSHSFDYLKLRTKMKLLKLQHSNEETGTDEFVQALQGLLEEVRQAELRGNQQSPILIEIFEVLGDTYVASKRMEDARVSYDNAMNVAHQLFAPDHEVCASLQHKLSEACLSCGRYDDALSMLQELIQWHRACPRDKAPPIPLFALQHSIGNVMKAVERLDEAKEWYSAALRSVGNETSSATNLRAKILVSLASVHLQRGDRKDAIALQEEALRLRLSHLPPTHFDVLSSYHALALLYEEDNLLHDAIQMSEKCMRAIGEGCAGTEGAKHQRSQSTQSHHSLSALFGTDGPRQHPFYVAAAKVKANCIRKQKLQQSKAQR